MDASDSLANKRKEFMISLRKAEINDRLDRRRMLVLGQNAEEEFMSDGKDPMAEFRNLVEQLKHSTMDNYAELVYKVRVIVSVQNNKFLLRLAQESGLIDMIVQFIHPDFYLEHLLLKESTW